MKKNFNFLCLFCCVVFFMSSCDKQSVKLEVGMWRGALVAESGVEIPFNFEVIDTLGKPVIYIKNSSEKIRVEEIMINDDSINIKMPIFDSEFKGILKDGIIKGVWIKHLADKDDIMSFYAKSNTKWRIKEKAVKATVNVNGKWATTFITEDSADTTKAIGEFVQNKSKVTGTFLTSTGDYRFLEGMIEGNKLALSTFDGSHAFLFTAKINKDSTMSEGKFYSGFSYLENFTAKRNENAELEDAYSLTYLKDGADKINFTFPNLEGKEVSINDEKYKNKVVLVQLLGSWCPNCMDETAFLTQYYNKNKDRGLEIIGLAYERSKDFEKNKKNISRLVDRFKIGYDILVTGYTNDKAEAAQSLPMLNKIIAFPTMIVIDKKGLVREIHTGFSGPGTGKNYSNFVNQFENMMNKLLAE
jgi:thiol-disulfide isomerase/thioredoxin